ncbi:hypothetical protein FA95DRAFT_1606119 [Auriscalpium vulgare]|uniref:Uncharacterized protein n=1 Tax=Auriscalpium vulgare TaxID=40419 RepID=A0ACB8RT15_9AGAM|nr:hypothetical protein FA95DRAFT_1606119 [Auriscalpium vulgare]
MPLPSQPIRSHSVPADLSSPSRPGWHPSWAVYRVRLTKAKNLVSFNSKAKSFETVPYPCYDNGSYVPPDELVEYWETRDFELPLCFCAVITGVPTQTAFIIPTNIKSPALGKLCLTCKTRDCPYFVVFEELLKKNPTPTSGVYPLLGFRRTAVTPPFMWNRHGTPTSTPPPLDMATRLLTGGPSTPTGKPTASGSNRLLTPSPLKLSTPKNSPAIKTEQPRAVDDVFSDQKTPSGSKAVPYLGDDAIFTQATPTGKKRVSPESDDGPDAEDIKLLTSSGADPTLITELLKTYTAGLALLHAIKPFEPQEANMALARTHDPSEDGITVQELVRSLGRCNACDRVMAHHLVGIHDCRSSPAKGGPVKKQKMIKLNAPKPRSTTKVKFEKSDGGSAKRMSEKAKGKQSQVRTRALMENGREVFEILSDTDDL